VNWLVTKLSCHSDRVASATSGGIRFSSHQPASLLPELRVSDAAVPSLRDSAFVETPPSAEALGYDLSSRKRDSIYALRIFFP
jgi:hypothetical protein